MKSPIETTSSNENQPNQDIYKVNLGQKAKDKFSSEFNSLVSSLGFGANRTDKMKSAFDEAEFYSAKNNIVITKNSKDENSYQVTFDGNCAPVVGIPLGDDFYVKAVYDKKSGKVGIISSTVFHIKNGEENVINLKDGSLEKYAGESKASDIREKFKNTTILVCSNPRKNSNSDEYSISEVAALSDGKTHGVQVGKKTALGVAGFLHGGTALAAFASAIIESNTDKHSKYGPPLSNSFACLVEDNKISNPKILQSDSSGPVNTDNVKLSSIPQIYVLQRAFSSLKSFFKSDNNKNNTVSQESEVISPLQKNNQILEKNMKFKYENEKNNKVSEKNEVINPLQNRKVSEESELANSSQNNDEKKWRNQFSKDNAKVDNVNSSHTI